MKKFLAVLFISAFLGVSAFAATSDTLTLSGTVTQVIDVTISETTAEFTLDYSGAGGFTTGDITLKSNRKAYTVSISSAKDGYLKNVDNADFAIPYKVKLLVGTTNPIVPGTGLTNNISSLTTPTLAGVTILTATDYRTPSAGKTFKLEFATVPGSEVPEGVVYTDTVTVTITATA